MLLDKLDSIKDAIDKNKVLTKQTLKQKWSESENATLQIALYKSICTDDERQNLNQSYVDHSTKGEKINREPITIEIIRNLDDSKKD